MGCVCSILNECRVPGFFLSVTTYDIDAATLGAFGTTTTRASLLRTPISNVVCAARKNSVSVSLLVAIQIEKHAISSDDIA